jgi:hypothetical protein
MIKSVRQIAATFRHFVADLQTHGTLRKRTDQRFLCIFGRVPRLFAMEEGRDAGRFVAGHESARRADHHVIEQIPHRQ